MNIQVNRCTNQTEWYLLSEDQEPELPVDTDESTEETYYDEVLLFIYTGKSVGERTHFQLYTKVNLSIILAKGGLSELYNFRRWPTST